jgi:SAM-dependent methyltransferase
MAERETDQRTIADFGEQWSRFPQNIGWLGSQDCLSDHLGPLMPVEELRGARIADIGSGSGRIVKMLLDAGAARVAAIEPSKAFYVMEKNLAEDRSRLDLIHDTGEAVRQLRDLDFVISFGVLHHIVDPGPVLSAAFEALRPGGRVIVWLYGYEGNEAYLKVFNNVRRITKRLPDPVLSGVASLLNVGLDIYIPLSRVLPLPMRDYMQNHLGKVDRGMRKITVFDQLNPAYAKYYRRQEAIALVADGGFEDVKIYHRHGYSWTVIGTKPARQ